MYVFVHWCFWVGQHHQSCCFWWQPAKSCFWWNRYLPTSSRLIDPLYLGRIHFSSIGSKDARVAQHRWSCAQSCNWLPSVSSGWFKLQPSLGWGSTSNLRFGCLLTDYDCPAHLDLIRYLIRCSLILTFIRFLNFNYIMNRTSQIIENFLSNSD